MFIVYHRLGGRFFYRARNICFVENEQKLSELSQKFVFSDALDDESK